MKNRLTRHSLAILVLPLLVFSCLGGTLLRTGGLGDDEIEGEFRLILYGGNHLRDWETIVILDVEGDPYTVVPYAPQFAYGISEHVEARSALEKASHFLQTQVGYSRSMVRRVFDGKGTTIAYEIRPLYKPTRYGVSDLLDVQYLLQDDGTVLAHVRLRLRPLDVEQLDSSQDDWVP
jgi:hypothetical protein